MAWIYFALSLLSATCAGCALWPPRRPAWRMPGFFLGWPTSELPLHHLAFNVLLTLGFLPLGVVGHMLGQLAIGLQTLTGAALVVLFQRQRRAAPAFAAALEAGLGGHDGQAISNTGALDEPIRWQSLVFPFRYRDPRVERIADLSYGPHGVRNTLDLYRPRELVGHAPVLLQIHGGAWIYGQKEHQGLPLLYYLASRGWLCAAVNYRLSPGATFPDHLVDVKRAIAWLRQQGADYGADPSFIALTGGSAGGHLAALAALTPNVAAYQVGFEGADTRVQACVPIYAPYDLVDRHGVQNDRSMEQLIAEQFIKRPLSEARELWEAGSPLSQVHGGAPPFFVIHGTHDSLAYVAGTYPFVEALKSAGVRPLVFAEIPGAQHAFDTFMSLRSQLLARAVHRFLSYACTLQGEESE